MATGKSCLRPDAATSVLDIHRSGFSLLLMSALCCTVPMSSVLSQENAEEEPTFANDIYPLFQERCAKCHTKKTRGDLSVNTREAVLKGGKSGKVVLPGESENSLLYKMVVRQKEVKPMPRKRDPLDDKDVELIKKWIDQGAK